jgi:nitrate/nitrite-specific signal transduction histidine kinase
MVRVVLDQNENSMDVIVEDNGCGMNLESGDYRRGSD